MKLYKVGEKSKAICQRCGEIRPTTFMERTVSLSSGKGSVSDVLVAVCDACKDIVSIPQQSTPMIQESIKLARQPLEARVPRHLLDVMRLVSYELGFGPGEQSALFRFFLQRVGRSKVSSLSLRKLANAEEAAGIADARFSIKLNEELFELMLKLEKETKLNRTDLVKVIIVKMKHDVLDKKNKGLREDLREILLLTG